jgi:aryl-alcohol dehydrogenase-like predicted oxidoreductase
MKTRKVGSLGMNVGCIGLGCMTMSGGYGRADPQEASQTLRRAVELGVTLFDTADIYGFGQNEEFLGHELRALRSEVSIATKCGLTFGSSKTDSGVNGRPEYVREACDASLRRLGSDFIDLYYLHRIDPSTPIEETIGEMSRLVAAGKVRYLGLSEAGASSIRRANAIHPITALQSEYSLWARSLETDVIPVLKELGIGLIPFSPLGRGFLTGKMSSPAELEPDDARRGLPRFQDANFSSNLKLLTEIQSVASERGSSASQVALAWVLGQGEFVVPIPGSKKLAHLEENLGASAISLSTDDLHRLSLSLRGDAIAGARYSNQQMRLIDG